MNQKSLLGLTLAASLTLSALVGCKAPNQTSNPPAGSSQVSPSQQQAGSENAQAAAEAMGDERETEEFDYMAEDGTASAYAVSALSAEAKARIGKAMIGAAVKAKIQQRRAAIKQRLQARLAKKAAVAGKLRQALAAAPVTEDENGNKTREFNFDAERSATVNGQARTRTMAVTAIRTVNAEGVLVYSKFTGNQTDSNGRSRSYTREKTLNADGSYTVVFTRNRTGQNGATYAANWTKTISAEGAASGTGTITLTRNGNTMTKNLTFGGTAETPVATVADAASDVTAEVTLPIEGEATATVSDPQAPAAEVTVTVEEEADAAAEVSAS